MAQTASDPRKDGIGPQVRITVAGVPSDKLKVKDYAIDNDIQSLGNPFRITVGIPRGDLYTSASPGFAGEHDIKMGALATIEMQDPKVKSGAWVPKLKGRVTSLSRSVDNNGGTTAMIGGQDLGWHLINTHAKLHKRITYGKLGALVSALIDPDWGFDPEVKFDNLENRHLNQGRTGASRYKALKEQELAFLPPIQIEPGQDIASLFIQYGMREKHLVDVSVDGKLMFFQPSTEGTSDYRIELHDPSSGRSHLNNVTSASLNQKIDGLYTTVTCVGYNMYTKINSDDHNPNRDKFIESYSDDSVLPFKRLYTFSDGDQLSREATRNRARWKFNQGLYESFAAEYTVAGHSQNGLYWAPDTLVDVNDTVLGVEGRHYISAVRYTRTNQAGTQTHLTLHKPDLLAA